MELNERESMLREISPRAIFDIFSLLEDIIVRYNFNDKQKTDIIRSTVAKNFSFRSMSEHMFVL